MKKYERKNGYIYKITNPKNRVYVGKTADLKNRMQRYRLCLCYSQKKIFNSIKFHGWENHTFEIIEQGFYTNAEMNLLETKYIKEFDSYRNGLNMTTGGDGAFGRKMSQSAKAHLSLKFKGRRVSEDAKMKMSIARKGVKKPDGFGKKISIARTGCKFTPEHRKNLSLGKIGCIPHNRKRVVDINSGMVFVSAKEASKYIGLVYSTVRSRLKKGNTNLIYA